jgi:hypothetical protein
MTRRAGFTDEEWQTLGLAVVCTGVAVAKAEHSGYAGESAERHLTAEGRYQLAQDMYQDVALIVELAETPESDLGAFVMPGSEQRRLDGLAYWSDQALAFCRDAVAILEDKGVAGELGAFRRYVIDLGWRVTYAGRPAAVMGIGYGAASDEEVAVMRAIAAALGVDAHTGEPLADSAA